MSTTDNGQILGASTVTGGGVALLPNTGGDPILMAFSIAAIAAGAIVLLSFAVTRLSTKFSR